MVVRGPAIRREKQGLGQGTVLEYKRNDVRASAHPNHTAGGTSKPKWRASVLLYGSEST